MAFKKNNIENGIFNKVLIRDILKLEDQSTQNVKILEKSPQVNIIAIIVDKLSDNEIFIDDSTGTIRVKNFNSDNEFKNLDIGDIVLILGKIRILNSQKLVSLIGVSKLDEIWLKTRKDELINEENDFDSSKVVDEDDYEINDEIDEDNNYEIDDDDDSQIFFKIIEKIEELDKGEGCSFDSLYNSFNSQKEKIQKYINYLIQEGQIFEISSGFLKVV